MTPPWEGALFPPVVVGVDVDAADTVVASKELTVADMMAGVDKVQSRS